MPQPADITIVSYKYELTADGTAFLELDDTGKVAYTGWRNGMRWDHIDIRPYSIGWIHFLIIELRDGGQRPALQLSLFASTLFELIDNGAPGTPHATHVVSAALLCDLAVPAALSEA
jgi:hypothetical protein